MSFYVLSTKREDYYVRICAVKFLCLLDGSDTSHKLFIEDLAIRLLDKVRRSLLPALRQLCSPGCSLALDRVCGDRRMGMWRQTDGDVETDRQGYGNRQGSRSKLLLPQKARLWVRLSQYLSPSGSLVCFPWPFSLHPCDFGCQSVLYCVCCAASTVCVG